VIQSWIKHGTTLAGNQVGSNPLITVVLAVVPMLPRARALGMPILPGALAVRATESIALLVMLARVLWLEQTARARQS